MKPIELIWDLIWKSEFIPFFSKVHDWRRSLAFCTPVGIPIDVNNVGVSRPVPHLGGWWSSFPNKINCSVLAGLGPPSVCSVHVARNNRWRKIRIRNQIAEWSTGSHFYRRVMRKRLLSRIKIKFGTCSYLLVDAGSSFFARLAGKKEDTTTGPWDEKMREGRELDE